MSDPINHPPHYTAHPSGVECIDIVEHLNFCLGNAIKYVWRAGLKDSTNQVEDLKKARWYVEREICRLEQLAQRPHYHEWRAQNGRMICVHCGEDLGAEGDYTHFVRVKE